VYTLKKSLGQHFLRDEGVCRRIVAELCREPFHQLLEVGPGGGALTRYLLEIPEIDFQAIELDAEKVAFLLERYPAIAGRITEDSILEVTVPFEGPFTVIGNFPYNISSQILFRVLDWRDQVERVVGMFQKEVAVRIAAGPGSKEYGILSVLLQAYFEVRYLFEVDERCFQPPPKVKSAVVSLAGVGNPYGVSDHRRFHILVKTAFGQRRKQLRNPLRGLFPPSELTDPIFSRRAEQLTVAEFVSLIPRMS
jgi:16S rRNA (adenine1518-N6/adenine1519-N6)-dimethyltransferase